VYKSDQINSNPIVKLNILICMYLHVLSDVVQVDIGHPLLVLKICVSLTFVLVRTSYLVMNWIKTSCTSMYVHNVRMLQWLFSMLELANDHCL